MNSRWTAFFIQSAMNFAEPKKKPYPFKLIEELAEEGPCIIMGRCAGYLMRNREEAFSVFVHADMETRIERVKERDPYYKQNESET